MYFTFFSFSGGEIFLVVLAVLVLFGANKIPELAKTLGKGMNEFRKATDEIKREFQESTEEFKNDLKESQKDITEHVKDISQTMSDPIDFEPQKDTEVKNEINTKSNLSDNEL